MNSMSHSLMFLFASWSLVTTALVILVIYGNTLSSREEDQLYLNKAEQEMMASEQQVLIGKMQHLARIIVYVAILSGLLLFATAGLWAWIGLHS